MTCCAGGWWSLCLALTSVLVCAGCAATPKERERPDGFERRCISTSVELRKMPLSQLDKQQPLTRREPGDRAEALKLYSPVAVDIADVMDLLPLLNQMARLENQAAPFAEIERVRRKFLGRLQLASLEVASLVAEIECEVQRADHVQDRLKQSQSSRTTFQTILAVIFGGVANILSGGFAMATAAGDTGSLASVTGGALEVLFGTSANFTKVHQEFRHPRNHLTGVWDGSQEHDLIPDSVWRYLTEPSVRDVEGQTLRGQMIKAWREEGRLGEPGSSQEEKRIALLFGEGGLYGTDELYVREAMLQMLESNVQLMHQDLETLLREVLIRQAMEEDRT